MIEHRAYCWINQNGGWQVGKPLLINGKITTQGLYAKEAYVGEQVIMQPSHAGMPVWVPVDDMQPYPAEPIEEPAVKGGE